MPGTYYFSVAIWDEHETFAFDYHKCRCKIEVIGSSSFGQLTPLLSRWTNANLPGYSCGFNSGDAPQLDFLTDKWGTELTANGVNIGSIKCLDNYGSTDSVFITGKEIKIKIDFKIDGVSNKNLILWLGVYRSDRIYCHGSLKSITASGLNSEVLIYPKMRLLPGGYNISAGIWDGNAKKFIAYSHGVHSFNMISDKYDHGTVYMEHLWKWKIPKGGKIRK